MLALKIPGIAGTPVMRRVYPRGTLAAQVLGVVGTEGRGLPGLEYSRNALLARARGRAARGQRRDRPAGLDHRNRTTRSPGESLDADARREHPAAHRRRARRGRAGVQPERRHRDRDGPAQRRDPRARQLAAGQRQRSRRRPAGRAARTARSSFDYEPGSTFKAVTVSGALQEGLITPDTPLQHPRPDPGRRPHDPRRHRTRRRNAHDLADPRPLEQRRRDQDRACSRAPRASTRWVHRFGFGAPTGVDLPGRGTGRDAGARATTRAPRWATCRSARASSSRRCRWRPPTRRSPTAASCARRTSCSAVDGQPRSRCRPGTASSRPPPRPQVRHMLEGVLAPGGTASEVSIPGYQLAGQDRHGEQDRPGHRRILENRLRRVVHRLRAGQRTPSCCARSSSTNRRPARSSAAPSPRRRSGRS